MSYVQVPTRTTADANASADINQLQDNIEAVKGGTPATAPSTDIETLATSKLSVADIDDTPADDADTAVSSKWVFDNLYAGNALNIKQYIEGTAYTNGTPTIAGVGGIVWTTTRGVFVPYQVDGAWRLRLNVRGLVAVSTAVLSITISGITAKNVSQYFQPFACQTGTTSPFTAAGNIDPNSNQINIFATATTQDFRFSGDVELNAKPTWAD